LNRSAMSTFWMILSLLWIEQSNAGGLLGDAPCCRRKKPTDYQQMPDDTTFKIKTNKDCVPCELEIKAMTWNMKAGMPQQNCCFNNHKDTAGNLIRDHEVKFLQTMMNQKDGVDVIFLQEPLNGGESKGDHCATIGTSAKDIIQIPQEWDYCKAGKAFDCSAVLFKKAKFTKVNAEPVSGNTGFMVGATAPMPEGGWGKAQKSPERFGMACQVTVNNFGNKALNLASFNLPHDPLVQKLLWQNVGRPFYNEGWMKHLTNVGETANLDINFWANGGWKTELFANERFNAEFPEKLKTLESPITLFGGDFNNNGKNVGWIFKWNGAWNKLLDGKNILFSKDERTCCPDTTANLGKPEFSEEFDHLGVYYDGGKYKVEIQDVVTLELKDNVPQANDKNFPGWQLFTKLAPEKEVAGKTHPPGAHAISAEHLPVRATFVISESEKKARRHRRFI